MTAEIHLLATAREQRPERQRDPSLPPAEPIPMRRLRRVARSIAASVGMRGYFSEEALRAKFDLSLERWCQEALENLPAAEVKAMLEGRVIAVNGLMNMGL
jgi:hypothetical protein